MPRIYEVLVVMLAAPEAQVSGFNVAPRIVNRSTTLGPSAIRLYLEVLNFIQYSSNGCCSASVRTLGKTIDRCERTARAAINELVRAGLLRATPRSTTTTLLWAEPLTLEHVIRLRPTYVTNTCWAALWARYRTDPWVAANCPESVRTPSRALPEGRQSVAALTSTSLTTSTLPQKTSSSSSGRDEGRARPKPESQTMRRKDKARAGMREALNHPGHRAEQERNAKRRGQYMSGQVRNDRPKPPTSILDLSDVHLWSSQDFVRLIRAMASAKGIKAWCSEWNPDGKLSVFIARTNRDMNVILDLLEASGIRDKRRQALLLMLWIKHWDDFTKVQTSAERVGFAPRYWAAAWTRIWPWLKNLVALDPTYEAAAAPTSSDMINATVAKLRTLYVNWPDDPELDEQVSKLMARRIFESAVEFKSIVAQYRVYPEYAKLWATVQGLQKA